MLPMVWTILKAWTLHRTPSLQIECACLMFVIVLWKSLMLFIPTLASTECTCLKWNLVYPKFPLMEVSIMDACRITLPRKRLLPFHCIVALSGTTDPSSHVSNELAVKLCSMVWLPASKGHCIWGLIEWKGGLNFISVASSISVNHRYNWLQLSLPLFSSEGNKPCITS